MNKLIAAFVAIFAGIAVGLISAQNFMGRAANQAEQNTGNWHRVVISPDTATGFYAASDFLRRGQLPPPRAARFYTRTIDDDGNTLRGGCVVAIEGKLPALRWWSLKAESADPSSSLDAGEAILESDGTLLVSASRMPSPGNWLKMPDDGAYSLDLVLFDPAQPAKGPQPALPTVKRLWC